MVYGKAERGAVVLNKQDLEQYQYLLMEIAQIEEEKQRIAGGMLGAARLDGMPRGSGVGDPAGQAAARLVDLAQLMADKLNQAVGLRLEIERVIAALPVEDRVLMRARYVEGKTWEQVAAELHYTYPWVWRLHGRILAKLGLA